MYLAQRGSAEGGFASKPLVSDTLLRVQLPRRTAKEKAAIYMFKLNRSINKQDTVCV